jgi:O-methyltransferase
VHNVFLSQHLGTPPRSSRFLDLLDRVLRKTVPWLRIESCWRGQMASIESRMNVFHLLSQTLINGVYGNVVEIGCHAGESSVVLQSVIQDIDPSRELHVFDSFQGVPPGDTADEGVYRPGEMAASETQLYENFDSLGLKRPTVHAGWFEETLIDSLPEQIAFALVDADLYQSTLLALRASYPRLSSNAICLFGVYWDPKVGGVTTTDMKYRSPGVKRACDEFFVDKPERINILLAGNYTSSYFRKI